jgi:hypothetical protein
MSSGYDQRLAQVEADLDHLVHRLRGLSRLAWSSRRDSVGDALQRLVAITSALEGRRPTAPPRIDEHALGDAIAVVGRDATDALSRTHDEARLEDAAAIIRLAMDETR